MSYQQQPPPPPQHPGQPAAAAGQAPAPYYQQQQYEHPQQHQQPGGAPAPAAGAGPGDQGAFPGGTYGISFRGSNALLNVDLAQGAAVRSKPGAMVHMSGGVQLTGKVKFSVRKMLTGGDMAESTYAGPGRVALAPTLFGDIVTLPVGGGAGAGGPAPAWKIGKDAFLACTADVRKEAKSQGFGKALFSGEDLFVYNVSGQGLLWVTSFGAVDRIVLQQGQQHIVDNGHLVAWSCNYSIEKAGGGGMTSLKTGEGLVCRFTGPGVVYFQTRNMDEFSSYVRGIAAGAQ